jgi:hypothetical protein
MNGAGIGQALGYRRRVWDRRIIMLPTKRF